MNDRQTFKSVLIMLLVSTIFILGIGYGQHKEANKKFVPWVSRSKKEAQVIASKYQRAERQALKSKSKTRYYLARAKDALENF